MQITPLVEEGSAFMQLSGAQAGVATERVPVVVIGGGQAGLAVGHHLARRHIPFVILDASARVGDSWRQRWESLRLFTPARFDALPGMPFPADGDAFPTKDEMADYLEAYATRFELPVRGGMRVERLTRAGDRYQVEAGGRRFEAEHVVVAMSNYQRRRVPALAGDLAPEIVQLHSSEYRGPAQLRDGGVLVVGAGNSGAEIALEAVRGHRTWLAGRDTGHIPFRIAGRAGRWLLARLVLRVLFHRVLTVRTPLGRKLRAKMLSRGGPLIRTWPGDLAAAGVERVARVTGVRDGKPLLEDGRLLDVANVVWCTGYDTGFSSWIDLPAFSGGEPPHESGVVLGEPGLYLVGQFFLHAPSSVMVHGVGRDAKRIVARIARRLVAHEARP